MAASIGIDRAGFDRAVADQAYLDKLNAATTEAIQKFGVDGTPSFFVNGEQVEVKRSFEEVADAVERAAH
ncbi:thioredoxin domain-containing protein [Agrobacterium sp. Rnr]|uniref:Thioredoxin domain-containing protein n=1 Tax=Agrobacterium burrii TaxID=2815339 RepID=A0ABS3EPZ9_9HYPH|nr:thioredoxin domain-containing protein [Agrobacterium burrii]